MKVILLEKIKNIGDKHEVKIVKNGYARNFLIPNQKAILATQAELDKLDQLKEEESKRAEEELVSYQNLASQIDGYELEIAVKVGQENKLFGAIKADQIAEKLNQNGFNIQKEQIKLSQPIKELGEYDIDLELPHNLEAKIKLIITEEK